MSDIITIEGRKTGSDQPVFIIAEIGVNHNGDLTLAKKMIREAARCGADCVKFQTFKADRVVLADAPKAEYQLKVTPPEESQLNMLKSLEMSMDAYQEIVECCRDEGVIFLSTPYNAEDVDFLDELGVSAFKLSSMHIVEPWLIKYTAKKGRLVILSTGMATLSEVEEAVQAFRETGNKDLVLLQCTTNYPSQLSDANLLAMQTMARAFDIQVGYSDHTQNDIACIVSVGLGATVIEKHFTTDKLLPGPDQSTSADPEEFSRLIKCIRNAETVLGTSEKEPCDIEKKNMSGMRRSIIAKCDIEAGALITEGMLTSKRPSTGLSPQNIYDILGKHAKKNIPIDTMIQWSHVRD